MHFIQLHEGSHTNLHLYKWRPKIVILEKLLTFGDKLKINF